MAAPALVADLRHTMSFARAIRQYAWVDVRLRFDRTFLGPFWIIVTTALWIGSVGLVMAELFKQPLTRELPYLTFGVFGWSFLSGVLSEAATAFSSHRQFLLAYRIPLLFCALRVVARNFIVLFMLTVVGMFVSVGFGLFHVPMLLHVIPVWIGLLLVVTPMVIVLGICGARFTDIGPAVAIVLNIMILVTPIFWRKSILPEDHPILALNFLLPLIDLYREMFLGTPSAAAYSKVLWLAAGWWAAAILLFEWAHKRVRLWL